MLFSDLNQINFLSFFVLVQIAQASFNLTLLLFVANPFLKIIIDTYFLIIYNLVGLYKENIQTLTVFELAHPVQGPDDLVLTRARLIKSINQCKSI